MKERKKMTPSLRKILLVILVVLLPIILVSIVFMMVTTYRSHEASRSRIIGSVETQITAETDELIRMNYFLIDTLMNNDDIQKMADSDNQHKKNVASRSLWDTLDFQAQSWAGNYSFFFLTENSAFVTRYNYAFPYGDNLAMRNHLEIIIKSGTLSINDLSWRYAIINGSVYLYQLYYDSQNYLCSWISCDILFSKIKTTSLTEKGSITYLSLEKKPLTDEPLLEEMGLKVPTSSESAGFNRVNDVFDVNRTNIKLYVHDEPYADTDTLLIFFMFIFLILLIILTVSIYIFLYFRNNIAKPFADFQSHISAYAETRANAKTKGFAELNDAIAAFDSLNEQLNELKIDVYEEKLEIVQTRLEYYHLQIKPHFFVNCFSVIHAMAQKKEYDSIQEFCVKLSNYVRYLLTDSMSIIPLSEELQMAHEYLDILKVRHRSNAVLIGNVDEELHSHKIPALLILTFIENSIKHGVKENTDLTIELRITEFYLDGEKRMKISVADNGPGFPEEFLEIFNYKGIEEHEDFPDDRQHIGIRNILSRLYLIYGNRYSIHFSNLAEGCMVEIIIPSKTSDD